MKTFKLPYRASSDDEIELLRLRKMQSIVIRTAYNQCFEGNSNDKSIKQIIASYNNIELPATMILYGIIKGKSIYSSEEERKKELKKQFNSKIEKINSSLAKLKSSKSKKRTFRYRKLLKSLHSYSEKVEMLDDARVVFGGRTAFYDRIKNKISKEEIKRRRLCNLVIFGEKSHHGNRHCRLDMSNRTLTIRMNKSSKQIVLHLPKNFKNMEHEINRLADESNRNQNKFAIEVSDGFVMISYDEFKSEKSIESIENRILAFDDNPNYIGISVTDWIQNEIHPKIVFKQVIDKSSLVGGKYEFDENLKRHFVRNATKNKIDYETSVIAKHIVKLARHFKCSCIVKEELNIFSSDKKKGKHFNRLCNNDWNRSRFSSNLKKRCNEQNIDLIEVLCCNSSKLGNMLYGVEDGSVPDMVASSIELARRSLHYHKAKDRFYFNKGEKLYPEWGFLKDKLNRWKEEASQSPSMEEFFKRLVGDSYRVKFREISGITSRASMGNIKSKVFLHYLK